MSRARDLASIFNLSPLSGTTAERPSTATVGQIYYNGTTAKTQIYTSIGWQDMASGIAYGNSAGRPSSPVLGQPYFNGEEKRLELYTSVGWLNIVSETPGVVSISGTYVQTNATNIINITGTNFSTGAIVSATGTNGVEVNAVSTVVNSIVSATATFSNLSPAYEPYSIKLTNTSNLFGLLPNALYVNDQPVWTTSAGSLGTFNAGQSVSVALAVADENTAGLTYSLAGGSLPSGLSLSTAGVISGTAPQVASATTYSFTISVTDGANTAVSRSFTISVTQPISGGTTSIYGSYKIHAFSTVGANSFTVNGTITADVMLLAGGGAGGAAGGGAGGLLYQTGVTIPAGTYSANVGVGGIGYSPMTGGSSEPSTKNGGNTTITPTISGLGTANGGQGAWGWDFQPTTTTGIWGSGAGGPQSSSGPYVGGGNTAGQGNVGGADPSSTSAPYPGAGGGGAGAAGDPTVGNTTSGNGGAGRNMSSYFGTSHGVSGWFAGGGGGATHTSPVSYGTGGSGGGGAGATALSSNGSSGTNGTGGGGGAFTNTAGTVSGNGGSGMVIIRYLGA
jgi:hypothetical protein